MHRVVYLGHAYSGRKVARLVCISHAVLSRMLQSPPLRNYSVYNPTTALMGHVKHIRDVFLVCWGHDIWDTFEHNHEGWMVHVRSMPSCHFNRFTNIKQFQLRCCGLMNLASAPTSLRFFSMLLMWYWMQSALLVFHFHYGYLKCIVKIHLHINFKCA